MTTSFDLQLPAPQKPLPNTIAIQSKGSVVILGANGSGKTRLGSWLEMQSGQKDNVHRISAQKSLTMPVVSVSTSVDAARAELIYATIERKLKSFDAKVIGESNLKSSLDNLKKTNDVPSIRTLEQR